MRFAGGRAQSAYMQQVQGLSPQQCLVVPIDVGKRTAMSLVADHRGSVVREPFAFALTVTGTETLVSTVSDAARRAAAGNVRYGIEAAGHYHRALATTLHARGLDVVELNPRAVKVSRTQLGQALLKTDERDCLAMVELLVRGAGWPFHRHHDQLVQQAMWVAHRRRKLDAVQALTNQVHALADCALPGLVGAFKTGLDSTTLRMLLCTIDGPRQLAMMTPDDLVVHARHHGRRMLRPKARQVIDAACDALTLPETQQNVAQQLVAREVKALETLYDEIVLCDQALAALLPVTPAGILTTIPGVGNVSASYYGAALGDPWRFANADAAYRYSGLAPTSYESSGRKSPRVRISREGAVELRRAMITLGSGIAMHHPDFIAYRRRLLANGKKPMVAAVAVAHRAHRLAFAMIRNQTPFDPDQWTVSVAKGQPATATEVTATT